MLRYLPSVQNKSWKPVYELWEHNGDCLHSCFDVLRLACFQTLIPEADRRLVWFLTAGIPSSCKPLPCKHSPSAEKFIRQVTNILYLRPHDLFFCLVLSTKGTSIRDCSSQCGTPTPQQGTSWKCRWQHGHMNKLCTAAVKHLFRNLCCCLPLYICLCVYV